MNLANSLFGVKLPESNSSKKVNQTSSDSLDISNQSPKQVEMVQPIPTVPSAKQSGRVYSRYHKKGNRNYNKNRQYTNPDLMPNYTSPNNQVSQSEPKARSGNTWNKARGELMKEYPGFVPPFMPPPLQPPLPQHFVPSNYNNYSSFPSQDCHSYNQDQPWRFEQYNTGEHYEMEPKSPGSGFPHNRW